MLSALREIRSRQNIPPRQTMPFAVRCDAQATAALLQPLIGTLRVAGRSHRHGDLARRSARRRRMPRCTCRRMDVYVDLSGVIDVDAEKQPSGETARPAVRYDCRKREEAGQPQLRREGAGDVVRGNARASTSCANSSPPCAAAWPCWAKSAPERSPRPTSRWRRAGAGRYDIAGKSRNCLEPRSGCSMVNEVLRRLAIISTRRRTRRRWCFS